MSSVLDNIRKNDNNFSFISTFFDLVGNKEFKDAEVSTLYTKAETSETSIWRSLSAIAEQLGSDFYNNTLNFIDNVSNIDLCKVQQLQSMISWLGVKYTIFNDVQYMPLDIRNLIDIFSVKREHLTSYVKMNNSFVNDLLSGIPYGKYDDTQYIFDGQLSTKSFMLDKALSTDPETGNPTVINDYLSCATLSVADINNCRNNYQIVSPDLSSFWTEQLSCQSVVDDSKFNAYMSAVYKNLLNSKLCATYNDKLCSLIYEQLSNNILLSDFALPNDMEAQIQLYKLLYNIPPTFNVQNEVDKYENGEVELSDYTEYQLSVLQLEINRRKASFKNEELKTRYKFYREREVKEYAEFIENEYSIILQKRNTDLSGIGGYYALDNQYALDKNYIELYNYTDDDLSVLQDNKLFFTDEHGKIYIKKEIVDIIAGKLVEITNGIRESRELLKMQCQKYFMRGTKLLLNSIVCEYLRSNVVNTLAEVSCIDKENYVFNTEDNFIDIVEYVDPTNYYNISVDSDALLSNNISNEISTLNEPFWKMNSSLNAIGAVDGTNLFTKLPTIESQNFLFDDANLSTFYNDMLKNKFSIQNSQLSTQLEQLKDFLNHMFELGADTSFISNDVFHTYDSYTAKKLYDYTVENNASKLQKINNYYENVLSIINNEQSIVANELSGQIDQTQTIDSQLSTMYAFIFNKWVIDGGNELATMFADVEKLCCVLIEANEEQEHLPLSALSAQLESKYELQNYNKQEAYQHAIKTDSFVLQQEYNTMVDNYTAGYEKLSTQFDVIVSAGYIPDDFKQSDLTLGQQVSSLCLCLSSMPAGVSRDKAINDVKELSSTLYSMNKLSVMTELEIVLETLSSQFEEELGYKKTEIDVLRSSDVFKSREKIFQQYSGTDTADVPFYYMSNVRHPSYMLHPYLSNYLEKEEYSYDIDNIANLANADETKKYMALHLSNLIDEDGYLINVWQNPLNCNTDYISRYEQVSHRTATGTESEVIGYDGLFYPNALADFLSSDLHDKYKVKYTVDISKRGLIFDKKDYRTILEGNFIESLSGVNCYNTQTGLYQHVIWNPWYEHLDLSKNEAFFIAKQLEKYHDQINDLAHTLTYDIFRYGLDAFNNSYILVKNNIKDCDEDEKLAADGCLWMRAKNHPIAFPAYRICFKDITDEPYFSDDQQITVNSSNCNKDILAFKTFTAFGNNADENKIIVPTIQDFTFSNNGNHLVLNGKMQVNVKEDNDSNVKINIPASYPVIVNVDQSYNYDVNIDKMQHFHYVLDVNNPTFSIIEQTTIEGALSDWLFQTYFYDEDKLGVIYSKIESESEDNVNFNNKIFVTGAYYNLFDKINKTVQMLSAKVDEITTIGSALENVCIDVNGDIMTVAYLDTLPRELVNYLDLDVDLNSLPMLCCVYGNNVNDAYLSSITVKTKEYQIGPKSFIRTDNNKQYTKYTDAGFYGLLGVGDNTEQPIVNNLYDTNIVLSEIPNRGVYKYQILSEPTPVSQMIDYRQILLVRPYENYEACQLTCRTPQGTEYYPITYMSAHWYEALANPPTSNLTSYDCLSSIENVYEPVRLKYVLDGKIPALKIDESYLSIANQMSTILSDGYPFFCISANEKFSNHPYGQSNVRNGNCMLNISKMPDFPMLSIQWGTWQDSNTGETNIQLDFNPVYYASEGNNEILSTNIYNNKKLFLNLNKVGEAGLLNIYADPINGVFDWKATYYIKNMSDDKPKFLLSAAFFENNDYPPFATEEDTIDKYDRPVPDAVILTEGEGISTAIAFEQYLFNASHLTNS